MVLAKFDPAEVLAAITLATPLVVFISQFLKKFAERLGWDWVAHGKGPIILAGVVTLFTVTLPDIVQDGKLTFTELGKILEVLGIWAGSGILYKLARVFAFTKR